MFGVDFARRLLQPLDALTFASVRHPSVRPRACVRAQSGDDGGFDLNAAFANAVKKTEADDKAKREAPFKAAQAKIEENKRAQARREMGFEVRRHDARIMQGCLTCNTRP